MSASDHRNSVKEALIIAIVNAALIGALVHYRGAGSKMTFYAVGAVAAGSAIGLLVGTWMMKNGYTMEAMLDAGGESNR